MRSLTIKGIDDNIKLELGSDVGLICEVIERGRGVDYLIYELDINGEELICLINKYIKNSPVIEKIKRDNRYILRAYDW